MAWASSANRLRMPALFVRRARMAVGTGWRPRRLDRRWHARPRDHDVDVGVRAGLGSQQCIYAPTAIQPSCHADAVERVEHILSGRHLSKSRSDLDRPHGAHAPRTLLARRDRLHLLCAIVQIGTYRAREGGSNLRASAGAICHRRDPAGDQCPSGHRASTASSKRA
jgi:hypothetical protein